MIRQKVILFPFLITLVLSSNVAAELIGVNIGTNHWSPELSGSFNSQDSAPISLNKDLSQKDHSSTSFSVTLEHQVKSLPNIRLKRNNLNSNSLSNISNTVTFDNTPYTGHINSNLDLSHNELTLYYQLLDSWVYLDLGLDLRVFDGKVSISDSTNTSSISVDKTVPLLYLSARVDLPFRGFYVGANIQLGAETEYLGLSGDSTSQDSTLMLGYQHKSGLGVEGGLKSFNISLDSVNELDTDIGYDGIFLNGFYHF